MYIFVPIYILVLNMKLVIHTGFIFILFFFGWRRLPLLLGTKPRMPVARAAGKHPAVLMFDASPECNKTIEAEEEEPTKKKQRLESAVMPLPGGFLENLLQRGTLSSESLVAQGPNFSRWRRIVCDWICDVCCEMDCSSNVYALSVAYMDRYLTYEVADSKTYQCVAATCIWIALKYENDAVYHSWAAELTTTGDMGFSARDMCRMELRILNRIHWRLDIVIPHVFVRFILSEHWDPLCDRTMVLFPRKSPISLAMGVLLSIEKHQKICLTHPFIDIMRSKADVEIANIVCDAIS